MEKTKEIIPVLSGLMGTILSQFLGVWSELLTVVLILMCIDIITGVLISFLGESTKSTTGYINSNTFFRGIAKKILMWFLLIIAHQADRTLNINIVRLAVTYWLIASEGLSIIENIGNIGIDIPVLTNVFEQIKEKGSGKK